MDIKKAVARAIKNSGISQRKLGLNAEIPATTINGYANEKSEPGVYIIQKLKNNLNVSYEYLLGESENKTVENYLVGKDLGLTDNSIEKLKSYTNRKGAFEYDLFYNQKGNTDTYTDIINKFIENKNFEQLLYYIRIYINTPTICNLEKQLLEKQYLEKLNKSTDESDKVYYEDSLYELENDIESYEFDYNNLSMENKLNVVKFTISEIFMKIINEIFDEMSESMKEKWHITKTKYGELQVKPKCKDGSETNKYFGYKVTHNDDNGEGQNNDDIIKG